MDSEIMQIVLDTIIAIAVILISRYIIPAIQNSTNNVVITQLSEWVKVAVYATEQIMKSNSGEEKKQYVLNFIKELLESENINLTDGEINILIEAAVRELKIAQSKESE